MNIEIFRCESCIVDPHSFSLPASQEKQTSSIPVDMFRDHALAENSPIKLENIKAEPIIPGGESEEVMLSGSIFDRYFVIKDEAFDDKIFDLHQKTKNISYRSTLLSSIELEKAKGEIEKIIGMAFEGQNWHEMIVKELDQKAEGDDSFSCIAEIRKDDFLFKMLLKYIDTHGDHITKDGKKLTPQELADLRSRVIKAYPHLALKVNVEEKKEEKSASSHLQTINQESALEVEPKKAEKGEIHEAFSSAGVVHQAKPFSKLIREKNREESQKEDREKKTEQLKRELRQEILENEIEKAQRRSETLRKLNLESAFLENL